MSKESFKQFVKKNPSLVKYVNNNEMTWQKFYEMFDIYGENNEVWNKYIIAPAATASLSGIPDLFNWIKNIDLNEVQNGLDSVGRVISVLEDLNSNKTNTTKEYKPRPLYKHFED